MKKGFTLIEMVIVLSMISILISFTVPNIVGMTRRANVDEFTNNMASMLKEAYENSNKEMDYSSWKVEINNHYSQETGYDEKLLIVRLMNKNRVIEEITSHRAKLSESTTGDFEDGKYYISYNISGQILVKKDAEPGQDVKSNMKIDVYDLDNTDNRETIEIKSLPPGNVMVKQ